MGSKGAVGIILVLLGGLVIVGSITGNFAPMTAALFDPTDLVTSPNSTSSTLGTTINENGNNPISNIAPFIGELF